MTKPKAPDPAELLPLTAEELAETPAEFRAEVIARLQRQVRRDLDRLERDGERAPISTVPLRLGIVLTKHSELTAIAPPASVHQQAELVNGLTQAEARKVLTGGKRTRTPQESGTEWEPGTEQEPGTEPGTGQRSGRVGPGRAGLASLAAGPGPGRNEPAPAPAPAGPRPVTLGLGPLSPPDLAPVAAHSGPIPSNSAP